MIFLHDYSVGNKETTIDSHVHNINISNFKDKMWRKLKKL
jgi:hypothetical protein